MESVGTVDFWCDRGVELLVGHVVAEHGILQNHGGVDDTEDSADFCNNLDDIAGLRGVSSKDSHIRAFFLEGFDQVCCVRLIGT